MDRTLRDGRAPERATHAAICQSLARLDERTRADVAALHQRFEERFDALNGRLDERFDALDGRLDDLYRHLLGRGPQNPPPGRDDAD